MKNEKRWLAMLLVFVLLCLSGCHDSGSQTVESSKNRTEEDTNEVTSGQTKNDEDESTEAARETEGIWETEGVEPPRQETALEALQRKLWLAALDHSVVEIWDKFKTLITGDVVNQYDRVICMPWTYENTSPERAVTVLHYDDMRVLGLNRILHERYQLNKEELIWKSLGSENKRVTDGEASKMIAESDFVVDTQNRISFIGEPLGENGIKDADRCRAAACLIEAALRYAGELHLINASVEDEMNVFIYLFESNYDLDCPKGKLLIQLGDKDSTPLMIEVSYLDSCREKKAEYSIKKSQNADSFYVIETAICFSSVVSSKSQSWKLGAWETYLEQGEENEYGAFKFAEGDFDGDKQTDRIFEYSNNNEMKEDYLVLSKGEFIRLKSQNFGSSVTKREYVSADFTGDGVDELFYTYVMNMIFGEIIERGIWAMTEDGFCSLVIHEMSNGVKLTDPIEMPVQIMITKVDDTHFIATQPDSDFSIESEVAENAYDNHIYEGMRTCVVNGLQVVKDEQKGDCLSMSGAFACGGYSFRVSWMLRYVDGVWGIENFTVMDKVIIPPPPAD